jgi:type I restriction enzyme, S subunit
MIDDLPPYPAYQDSGLPWLGKLPRHWTANRLRHVCEMLVSNVDKHSLPGELPVRLCNYVDVYKNERISCRLAFMHATATLSEVERFRVRVGDVIITKDSEDWRDIGVPTLVEYQAADLVCGYHLAILRARRGVLIGGYLQRLLQSQNVATQLQIEACGVTRYGLSHGAIRGVWLPITPADEQAAIVRFLDHAHAKIERAVRAKRQLIALLNEQKQAIIHRAVTRGLDPNVPLKPSGIPWLGDVPGHWASWRISRFAWVGNGSTPSRAKPTYWNNGSYPWLNSSQVNRGFIDSADQFVTSKALRECHLPRVPAGSLLVAITGQGKTRGTAAVLGFEATINQHVAFVNPHAKVVSAPFLHLVFIAAYKSLRALSEDAGSTKGALTCEDIKRFKVCLPTQAEQSEIVDHVRSETATLNAAISRTEREIALLREYRTTLTAEVVTGKLDVRAAAQRLPAIAEAPPLADDLDDERAEP